MQSPRWCWQGGPSHRWVPGGISARPPVSLGWVGGQRVCVRIKFFFMENPFKADQKVTTKIKGVEVEAVVRLTWQNEVQVRTADGKLLWRTVKTVRPVPTPATACEPAPSPEPVAQPEVPPSAPAESAQT